mgnify:CR=1 FL=1
MTITGLLAVVACTSAPTHDKQHSIAEPQLTERYWKLLTLNDKAIVLSPNQDREAHFILKNTDNRLTGYSGCNAFFGSYTLESGHRIRFDQVGATKRACPDVQLNEFEFLRVFGLANHYRFQDGHLTLTSDGQTPLAVFKSVEF